MTEDQIANVAIGVLGGLILAVHVARGIGWWMDWHTNPRPWKAVR